MSVLRSVQEAWRSIRRSRFWFYLLGVPVVFALVLLASNQAALEGLSGIRGVLSEYLLQLGYILIGFVVMHVLNLVEADFDIFDRIHEHPIGAAIFWGLVFYGCLTAGPALGQRPDTAYTTEDRRQALVDVACSDRGVTERPPGSNKGERVEEYLAHVGLGPGYPYCAAAASYWADAVGLEGPVGEAGEFEGKPIRSALSAHFLTAKHFIPARRVKFGWDTVPCGSIGVYLRGNTRSGHTVVVRGDEETKECPWEGRCGLTIEANTTPGAAAPPSEQRDGGGVWRRTRCIDGGTFRLIGFAVPR